MEIGRDVFFQPAKLKWHLKQPRIFFILLHTETVARLLRSDKNVAGFHWYYRSPPDELSSAGSVSHTHWSVNRLNKLHFDRSNHKLYRPRALVQNRQQTRRKIVNSSARLKDWPVGSHRRTQQIPDRTSDSSLCSNMTPYWTCRRVGLRECDKVSIIMH